MVILLIGEKRKNTNINSINDYDKCFQYTSTVALNHEEIGKNSQKISKSQPVINKYNWKGTNFPLGKDDWKKFEKNNPTLMCYMLKKMTIYPAYISKHNLNHEKQIILLMISNKKQ